MVLKIDRDLGFKNLKRGDRGAWRFHLEQFPHEHPRISWFTKTIFPLGKTYWKEVTLFETENVTRVAFLIFAIITQLISLNDSLLNL